MSETKPATYVVIGPVRLSYAHIWEPSASKDSAEKKYSTSLIIPKADKKSIAQIETAIEAAKTIGKATKFGGKTSGLKLPLRDGSDREGDPAYENSMFINATSINQPGVVDKHRNPITSKDECKSGDWVYVSLNLYPFNVDGNKGVAAGLGNIMKYKTGEPLSGGRSVEADFADIELPDDDDDDFMN